MMAWGPTLTAIPPSTISRARMDQIIGEGQPQNIQQALAQGRWWRYDLGQTLRAESDAGRSRPDLGMGPWSAEAIPNGPSTRPG